MVSCPSRGVPLQTRRRVMPTVRGILGRIPQFLKEQPEVKVDIRRISHGGKLRGTPQNGARFHGCSRIPPSRPCDPISDGRPWKVRDSRSVSLVSLYRQDA